MTAAVTGRRLAVLHVSQPGSEGVGNYVGRVAALQAARGDRVAVACPGDTPLAATMAEAGLELHPWSAGRHPGCDLGRELVSLRSIVLRSEPDVIHLHSSKAGMVGRLVLRGRLPTVFQPHAWSFQALPSPLSSVATGWERLAGSWAHVIVAVSDEELALAGRWRIGAGSGRLTIANPVDTDRFHPEPPYPAETTHVRRSLGLGDAPLVACVGRLCHQKGQDHLLRAWPRVVDRVPPAQLLLVGDGPDRSSLAAIAGPHVHVLGTRADVAALLRASRVVVSPSRWEGMSMAILEAMATARPVVATDVPGSRDAIGGEAGAVVAPQDGAGLAAAVVERLTDPVLANAEGEAGRRRVIRQHRWITAVEGLDGAYRRAITSTPQRLGQRAALGSPARVHG